VDNFSQLVSGSSRVLLYIDNINSFDKASAVVGLIRFLRAAGKSADLLVENDPEPDIRELLNKNEVELLKEVKPRNYTITINYGRSGIEKVVWDKDEKNKKLVFQIAPGDDGFTFDDVQFSEGSSKYDLTIVLGLTDLKDAKLLLEDNEYLLKENKVVVITRSKEKIGDLYVPLGNDGSFSESVYNLLKDSGADLTKETVEILLNGTINHRKILEGNASSNSWNLISSMIGQGADFNKLISDAYFSKSQQNLDLQIELMKNVKRNEKARLIWAVVDQQGLRKARVTADNLDVRGRIPFNISSDFDLAFAVYEIGGETLKMVVESNDTSKYSASVIAGVFDGEGGEAHAECLIKGFSASEFESKLFPILKDLYGIQVDNLTPETSKKIVLKGKTIDKKPGK
jgi:hypothetical protein